MSAGFVLLKAKLLLVFLICVHQIMKGLPLSGVQTSIPEKNVQRGGSWANVGFFMFSRRRGNGPTEQGAQILGFRLCFAPAR